MTPPLRITVVIVLILAGCAPAREFARDLNYATAQLAGTFTAPLLGGSPGKSGCTLVACLDLEGFEQRAYGMIDDELITYVQLVDWFYQQRGVLFADSNDTQAVREVQAFQRLLAQHVDSGRVKKSEWAYLNERKLLEYQERVAKRAVVCNTTNTGTREFPAYRTVCRQ